jgi:hypothetical protein
MNGGSLKRLRARLLSPVTRSKDILRRAIADAVRPFCWRPISTAPFNRTVKLRIYESGGIVTLPFPCRRTNRGYWINVDLGTVISIDPTHWCVWRRRSPAISYRPSTRRPLFQTLRSGLGAPLAQVGRSRIGAGPVNAGMQAAAMRLKTNRIVRQALLGNGTL